MKRLTTHASIALTLGLALTVTLLWLLDGATRPATAAPACQPQQASGDVITVCLSGGCDYTSIQAAVDAAAGGEIIKVATGTYTGVHARADVAQVVYISKTVTVCGGYTTTNWTTPYPITQPTTLDAQRLGRVMYVTGSSNVIIENLRITGGYVEGNGGGIYNRNATLTVSNTIIISNFASIDGGGVYLWSGSATFNGGQIISNVADEEGGGMYIAYGSATLDGGQIISNYAGHNGGGVCVSGNTATFTQTGASTIAQNTAGYHGGGVCVQSGSATLIGGQVIGNTVDEGDGGGVFVAGGSATLNGGQIIRNSARIGGGGIHVRDGSVMLNGNTILSNTAEKDGGGLYLRGGVVIMTNTVIADNRVELPTWRGSGLYIQDGTLDARHNTIARNSGGDGSGIHITGMVTVAMTNTILVSHTVGITVMAGSTAVLNGILWYSNTADYGGEGTITITNAYTGNPAFAADGYHLKLFSEAVDKGVDAGVTIDIDSESRPCCFGYDIGADELSCVYLPVVLKNYRPLCNGDFETCDFTCWTHGGELNQSVRSTMPHTGDCAALLGDPVYDSNGGVPVGSAWMCKSVSVPSTGSPTLSFWYHIYSYDVLTGTDGITIWDSFDVYTNDTLILRDGGRPPQGVLKDIGWKSKTYDLTAYRGEAIDLCFYNWNRTDGYQNTWTYVDDVMVTE